MFDLRAALAGFAVVSILASGCGGVRIVREPRVIAVAASPDPEGQPVGVAPPLEPRRQQLLPVKLDPAAESFLRAHSSTAPRGFSAESPLSLTAMAVLATGHAEARGLAPDPTFYGAQLGEGERAELVLNPVPSCVTVVVHGGLGVMEVDAFIVDGPPDAPRILAADDRAGPAAVVGGQGMCAPLSVGQGSPRVVVVVRRGAGPVVMGVFRGDRAP
ncbi:MAG: hypothetical protein JNK04_08400 [Myxococcales bacterium]|nr:hypothetical protein [Myxococcales bacterium]